MADCDALTISKCWKIGGKVTVVVHEWVSDDKKQKQNAQNELIAEMKSQVGGNV